MHLVPSFRAAGLRHCVLVSLAAVTAVAVADTQSWEYKAYMKDRLSGQYSKERYQTSTVSVDEKDGKASFRMITPGRGDPCFSKGELPAEVERTTDTVTVTVTPALTGCEPFRYVIRADGSGGVKQNRRGDRWVDD